MISAPPHAELEPHPRPSRRAAQAPPGCRLTLALLLALTLVAGLVRFAGLAAPDGFLNTDEARLALSARGVLESGVPVLPSGRVYTRGLLNSYLVAPAFAALGQHDFAARLPSALAGLLLVPAVFLLGRAYGGSWAGLAAAAFVALSNPLVDWSQLAWPPSLFLLLFMLAAWAWYRGFVEDRARWQVLGSVLFLLALMSYEFAMLLPGGLALYLVWCDLTGRRDWLRGRTTLMALGLLLGGGALFGALSLALRAGTLAGPQGEVQLYFSPGLSLRGPSFYYRMLLAEAWPLIAVTLLGALLLARARPAGTVFLLALLGVAFMTPSFVIQAKFARQYGLACLPLLAVLAAAATAQLANWLAARWAKRRASASPGLDQSRWAGWLVPLALLVVFGLAMRADVVEAQQRFLEPPSTGATWLQALEEHGLRSTDLLLAEAPTIVQLYLGRDEFYVHPEGYERYTYQAGDVVRSIYTNSIVLRERGDFERLIEAPGAGRTLWVVGRQERLVRLMQQLDPDLLLSIVRSAERPIQTPDGWAMLRLTLPRRERAG